MASGMCINRIRHHQHSIVRGSPKEVTDQDKLNTLMPLNNILY